jgi:ribose 5-phosphate isomerase A
MSGAPEDGRVGKAVAAAVATAMIPMGARLALGTGSTVEAALPMLAKIPGLVATPTSQAIADCAVSVGLALVPVEGKYDFYLDGVDQVTANGDVIKGSWGAHVREKTLAALSSHRILICDERKLVEELVGPVPVAIVPYFAGLYTASTASKIDENGLTIADIGSGAIIDSPYAWDEQMCRQPGIVVTGLFPSGFVDQIIIGHDDGSHHVIVTSPDGSR